MLRFIHSRLGPTILAGAILLVGVFFLVSPASEQTTISQSGPLIVVGTGLADKTKYSFNVGVIPSHVYEFVITGRGPGTISSNLYDPSKGVEWSADSPGATGQVFALVPALTQIYSNAAGYQIQNCFSNNPGLASGQSQICVTGAMPWQTIQINTTSPNAGNSYDLRMIDVTGALGSILTPTLSSNVYNNGTAAGVISALMIVGGLDSGNNARSLATNSSGQPIIASINGTDDNTSPPQTGAGSVGNAPFTELQELWYRPGAGAIASFFKRGVGRMTSATATASGNTAVWTPTVGAKFRVLCVGLDVTQNAAAAAAGVITIQLEDGSTPIPGLLWSVFVPSAAGTTFGSGYHEPVSCFANGFISSTANNVLNVNLSAALTAGNVTVRAYGTDE